MIFFEKDFPFSPLKKWNTLEKSFEKTQQELSDFLNKLGSDEEFTSQGNYPKCNVIEYNDSVLIQAEIVGYSKEDISLDVTEYTLTISGKNKPIPANEIEPKYLLRELKRSSFKRTFQFGNKFDMDNISSTFKEGILLITIPFLKEEKPKTKQIEIK